MFVPELIKELRGQKDLLGNLTFKTTPQNTVVLQAEQFSTICIWQQDTHQYLEPIRHRANMIGSAPDVVWHVTHTS